MFFVFENIALSPYFRVLKISKKWDSNFRGNRAIHFGYRKFKRDSKK
jgi:hypothetical protein